MIVYSGTISIEIFSEVGGIAIVGLVFFFFLMLVFFYIMGVEGEIVVFIVLFMLFLGIFFVRFSLMFYRVLGIVSIDFDYCSVNLNFFCFEYY